MTQYDVDVLIAGGSVAGVAAAAALKEFGWSVLIVEPGQRAKRRLAGELIHPMGVAGLTELGLLDREAFGDAAPIDGFVVFPQAEDPATRVTLSYGPNPHMGRQALALDYDELRAALQAAARRMGHVTFAERSRVTAIDLRDADRPRVSLDREGRSEVVSCRMVVAADGASSSVRSLAGIGHTRRTISTISGYVMDGAALPAPGFGHVFVGGPSLVLGYEIGRGRARVMFDQPVDREATPAALYRDQLVSALPARLRREVAAIVREQKPLSFKSAEVIAAATTRGRVILVGDAGGSCHPLTATGMTAGIRDGLRLRDALRRHDGDIPAAFATYSRVRRTAQRSRRMVASALHDTYSGREPEIRLLRAGLIRYWTADVASQTSTMAILAMTDDRVASAFRHLFKVFWHGLADFWACGTESRWVRLGLGAKLIGALGALALRTAGLSLKAR